jgi:nicotinamidase-related amidase
MALPLPAFYRSEDVGSLRFERAAEAVAAGIEARRRHPPRSGTGVAAFGIDCQTSFCTPGGSLFVPGAVEDTERTCRWLYTHADVIESLVLSLDTHRLFQVFHPAWWRDASGRVPEPLTVIRPADIEAGRYRPIADEALALEYARKLEAGGRYVITLWPYHGLQGGVSHALEPSLMEAALFFSAYREVDVRFETKGANPLTEHFSVFRPEVSELGGRSMGGFNQDLADHLLGFDRVYVFGQAKSHCVLSSVRDLVEHRQRSDPEAVRRIHLLEDAMSPVPPPPLDPLPPDLDFPAVATRAFAALADAGVRRTTTAEVPVAD